MSNTINLNLGIKSLTFNFGDFTLDYQSDDAKETAVLTKSEELTKKASEYEAKESEMAYKDSMVAIKQLIDEFFEVAFDATAPQKIYEAAGKNTWNYLNVFMQISAKIREDRDKKLNDENFKKFLAE